MNQDGQSVLNDHIGHGVARALGGAGDVGCDDRVDPGIGGLGVGQGQVAFGAGVAVDEHGPGAVGRDAWFNALPPYVASQPLWKYALSPNGPQNFKDTKSIYQCPTAAAEPLDPSLNPGSRVIFQYGMNSKGMWEQGGKVQVASLKAGSVRSPAAFAMFSDNRVRVNETPYYGSDVVKAGTLGSPQNYTSRFSSRHQGGGNITFSDGHAQYFKYAYVVVAHAGKPSDPARPDINWTHDGTSADGLPPQ